MRFEDPVLVVIDGKEVHVVELAEAGRLLLTRWPLDTSGRRKAMSVTAAALRGDNTVGAARRAFIDAAIEVFCLRAG